MAEDKDHEIGQGGLDLVVEEAQPKLRKPPMEERPRHPATTDPLATE